jgi:MoxR-like ATPase
MEERQVTIAGDTYELEPPFMVLATQNPVELQGTYPLAEAQLDRFALKLEIGYPTRAQEKAIVSRVAGGNPTPIEAVGSVEQIMAAREQVTRVHLEEKILDYIVDLTFATREPTACGLPDLQDLIEFGASPRATIFLTRASRARAYLRGRDYVLPDDVKAMTPAVMRHRIKTTYEADARGIDAAEVIRQVLATVSSPRTRRVGCHAPRTSFPRRSWHRFVASSFVLANWWNPSSAANTVRCSRAAGSSSQTCANTNRATTYAPSTGTSLHDAARSL